MTGYDLPEMTMSDTEAFFRIFLPACWGFSRYHPALVNVLETTLVVHPSTPLERCWGEVGGQLPEP